MHILSLLSFLLLVSKQQIALHVGVLTLERQPDGERQLTQHEKAHYAINSNALADNNKTYNRFFFYSLTSFSQQEWMRVLRPMCVPQQPRVKSPSLQHITEVRTLYITLLEAHRLPVKLAPHPYCIMSLNQVRVCRTQVKCPPDPVWEEDFVLEEIPNDVTSFTITVFNKGKRSSSKDTEVAEMSVEFAKLKNGQEVEEWYSLNGLTVSCIF